MNPKYCSAKLAIYMPPLSQKIINFAYMSSYNYLRMADRFNNYG